MRLSIFPIATLLLFASVLLASCKAEKVQPTEPVQEISKYDLIPGDYKMYDTLGNFLYEMNIKHIREVTTNPIPKDSLLFTNFDGRCTFKTIQNTGTPANEPNYSFLLGVHDTVRDNDGNRFFFFGYSSYFNNDSIFIDFKINNMRYYLSDMIPFYSKREKQIGVKQH